MKRITIATVLIATMCMNPAARASAPASLWSHAGGDAAQQNAYSVAVDAAGNVYVAGSFEGTLTLGPGVTLTSAGSRDIFLVKFSPAGVPLWSKRFGDASYQEAVAVATDALTGSVFITGNFGGSLDFGGGPFVNGGSNDIFIARFDRYGNHWWSKALGDVNIQFGTAVACDAVGTVFIAGDFNGSISFTPTDVINSMGSDMFLAKYDPSGVFQWGKRFGDADYQMSRGLSLDGSGNVYFAGYFYSTVDFGGGSLLSAGLDDVCLAKFDTAGNHLWSKRFGDANNQSCQSVATDPAGNVLLTGSFQGTIDFGGGGLNCAGAFDIFAAKLNSAGVHQWSRRYGDGGGVGQFGYGVATDGSGNVFLTGLTSGSTDFGGGPLVTLGIYDAFLLKLDASGAHQWSRHFGDAGWQEGRDVAVDAAGSACMAGHGDGDIDFGNGKLSGHGANDAFVARFSAGAAAPAVTSITDVGNDQGRSVRIKFTRSGADDANSVNPVERYDVYRRDDALPLLSAAGAPEPDMVSSGWLFAGSAPAHADDEYGVVVPTLADSTIVLGQYYSTFFVRAATTLPSTYYDSAADSGYSLDNLAPGIPQNFAYTAGSLSWDESAAADFDFFTVYGGNTSAFASATPIDYTVTPEMDVNAAPYAYYFVTATDFSGNEGKPAVVNPASSVGGTPREYALTVSAYPNPFNPATTVRYTVPSKGRVEVSVYDARGTRVATLVDADQEAGAYTRAWDGRDGAGRAVSSGVYFARVSHASGTRAYKMVLLK